MSYYGSVLAVLCICAIIEVRSQLDNTNNEPEVVQLRSYRRRTKSHVTDQHSHNISIIGDDFVLDGEPLRIISGSLHYFRLPSEYWRDRLRKLKAAGLNSVSTYVEWSYHEPEERQYSFDGDRDLARFIRIAAEEGLFVLLRPGPYICAERDLGGFPYWLLGKYPNIKLRTLDPDFIHESEIWLAKLFQQLKPLLYGNGGPIILAQVENEYGSYGKSKTYMKKMRDILSSHVGNDALLYTADGTYDSMLMRGSVSGTLTTINFGTGTDVKQLFKNLRKYVPHGPLMNAEYYPGWLTHWGQDLQQVPTDEVIKTFKDILENNGSVNFYMFYGGTNFEFTSGANTQGSMIYEPDVTSYDYDAPLSEAGDPTPKYYAIRDLMIKLFPVVNNTERPIPSPKGAYGKLKVSPKISLLSAQGRSQLGKVYEDVTGGSLPTFEKLRQRAGFLLFETMIGDNDGLLQITMPRDRVYVFVDDMFKGLISRKDNIFSLPLKTKNNSKLSLLVENLGRVNYGNYIHDFKGILSKVTLGNKVLETSWKMTGYPLQNVSVVANIHTNQESYSLKQGPVLYEKYFTLASTQPALDTFLDSTGWGKGYAWINGYNLGRYWPGIGPQVTLYVPGVWLRPSPHQNLLQILELERTPEQLTMEFIDYPIINRRPNTF